VSWEGRRGKLGGRKVGHPVVVVVSFALTKVGYRHSPSALQPGHESLCRRITQVRILAEKITEATNSRVIPHEVDLGSRGARGGRLKSGLKSRLIINIFGVRTSLESIARTRERNNLSIQRVGYRVVVRTTTQRVARGSFQ